MNYAAVMRLFTLFAFALGLAACEPAVPFDASTDTAGLRGRAPAVHPDPISCDTCTTGPKLPVAEPPSRAPVVRPEDGMPTCESCVDKPRAPIVLPESGMPGCESCVDSPRPPVLRPE